MLRGPGVERVIPVDAQGRFLVDWSLALDDHRVTKQSLHELLKLEVTDNKTNARVAPVSFKKRLVIIGSLGTGSNIADHGSTPLDKDSFLVSSHWNVLNNLLTGRFVRRAGIGVEWLLILMLGAGAGGVALRLDVRRGAGALAVGLAAFALVCVVVYSRQRVWLPLALPVLTALAAHVAVVTWRS